MFDKNVLKIFPMKYYEKVNVHKKYFSNMIYIRYFYSSGSILNFTAQKILKITVDVVQWLPTFVVLFLFLGKAKKLSTTAYLPSDRFQNEQWFWINQFLNRGRLSPDDGSLSLRLWVTTIVKCLFSHISVFLSYDNTSNWRNWDLTPRLKAQQVVKTIN